MYANALISQSALAHNLSTVKQYAANTQVIVMVKADAYGHHLDLVEPLIEGADLLAVSELYEAKILRKKTNKPILLLAGVYSLTDLQHAIALDCHLMIHHFSQLSIISQTNKIINIWLKIDTGMHRLGLTDDEYHQTLPLLQRHPQINIQGIMSHFACADEPDNAINNRQFTRFNNLTSNSNCQRSMANSAAILSNPASHFEFVRPGIMLYGVSPFGEPHNELKAVMQLTAPILSIKTVEVGESVGYGGIWIAKQKTRIAVIGIGYGDGYPRHAKTGTPMMLNGKVCPLIGRVSMDLICANINNIQANIGDLVTLWGAGLHIEKIAKCSDTIGYELLTGLSNRVSFAAVR